MMYRKFVLVSLVLVSVAGCSSRFAYNNLDWLVHWYLDDYVDLTRAQKSLFDDGMAQWLAWHRSEELQKYADQLQELTTLLNQQTSTVEDWHYHIELGRQHWKRLGQKVLPDLIPMARHLSEEQIATVFQEIESAQRDMEEERADTSPAERQRKQLKRTLKNIRDKTGPLSEQQKQMIEGHYLSFESSFALWLTYRRAVQAQALDLMVRLDREPQAQLALESLLLNPESHRSEEYHRTSQHNQNVFAQLMVDLHASLTPKQRRRLLAEIDDLTSDINILQNQ